MRGPTCHVSCRSPCRCVLAGVVRTADQIGEHAVVRVVRERRAVTVVSQAVSRSAAVGVALPSVGVAVVAVAVRRAVAAAG